MSRPAVGSQQRPLSLTEELERLEQSITLTLQEIDHNFSRAHRIVTSSILPIVEQYAEHSREVWEGSKFWKQFFEASANVSLSGYEEQQSVQGDGEDNTTEDSGATTHTTLETSESYETPGVRHVSTDSIEDVDLSNLTISPSHSTPRPPKQKTRRIDTSPYKTLQQDVDQTTNIDVTYASISGGPQTPSRQTSSLLDDVAMTPEQSPEVQHKEASLPRSAIAQKRSDPLLHTILDKNYRIQATPLTSTRTTRKLIRTPAAATRERRALEQTLESSPLAPPTLHVELLDSPLRREITQSLSQQRTPGVSVLTPGQRKDMNKKQQLEVWDSDEESLMEATANIPQSSSPLKNTQFQIPQSRLLKTPAREASKHIVDNILASAGIKRSADGEEELDDFEIDLDLDDDNNEMDESSPSIVRRAIGLEDETF